MGNACCAGENSNKAETAAEIRKAAHDERVFQDVGNECQPSAQGADTRVPRAPAPAPTGPGTEFKMTIYKTADKKLGVDVDHVDGVTLLVVGVTAADGLFQQWNDTYPDLNVKPGDRIIEVNGVGKKALKMVDQLRKNTLHELVVRRGP